MKVSIYNENQVKKEPEFFLRLVQIGLDINLVLVYPDGNKMDGGILLEITKDMRFKRTGYINSTLGLPLNEKRQLELEEPSS